MHYVIMQSKVTKCERLKPAAVIVTQHVYLPVTPGGASVHYTVF